MARARLIKPAFFGDVTLSEVSRDARLLYTGLWQLMDRRGLMEYHPKLVKRDLFPYDDDVTATVVEEWVIELARINRLRVVRFDGKRYLHCPYLPKHQHFHREEKPNALIPAEVETAPEELFPAKPRPAPCGPGANPVPAQCEPEANPALICNRISETNTEAEADPNARARDTDLGPDHRLADLPLRGFLDDVPLGAQRTWIDSCGLELVRRELPTCVGKWYLDPKRRTPYMQAMKGGKPTYVFNWMKIAKDDAGKPRGSPRYGPDVPSVEEFAKGGSS